MIDQPWETFFGGKVMFGRSPAGDRAEATASRQ